jgi:preprotein translocase subunit SecE
MSAPSSPHEYAIVFVVVVVVAVIFVVEDALFEKHVRLGPNGASVSSHTLVVAVVVVVVVQAHGGETDVVGVELAVVDMVDIAAPWIGILRLLMLPILLLMPTIDCLMTESPTDLAESRQWFRLFLLPL